MGMKQRSIRRKDVAERKRKEAEERQEARATRTDKQQIAKLNAGGFKAARERAKLQGRIDRAKRIKDGS